MVSFSPWHCSGKMSSLINQHDYPPPLPTSFDTGLTDFDAISAKRLTLLDESPPFGRRKRGPSEPGGRDMADLPRPTGTVPARYLCRVHPVRHPHGEKSEDEDQQAPDDERSRYSAAHGQTPAGEFFKPSH